jgi:hypothetical protein
MSNAIGRTQVGYLLIAWIATALLATSLAIAAVAIGDRIGGIESRRESAVRDSVARRPDNLVRILDSARVLRAAGQPDYAIRYFLAIEGLQDTTFVPPTEVEVRKARLLRYGAWYPAVALVLVLPLAVLAVTWKHVDRLHGGQLAILSVFLIAACWFLLAVLRFYSGELLGCSDFSCKIPTFWVEFATVSALFVACSAAPIAFWWSWFGRRLNSSGSRPPFRAGELEALLDHIAYEYVMFALALSRWRAHRDVASLELLLLHGRALRDFLFGRVEDIKRDADKVLLASDYAPGFSLDKGNDQYKVVWQAKHAIDAQLSHLSRRRADNEAQRNLTSDADKIGIALQAAWTEFEGKLSVTSWATLLKGSIDRQRTRLEGHAEHVGAV